LHAAERTVAPVCDHGQALARECTNGQTKASITASRESTPPDVSNREEERERDPGVR
jgi:hypothetical protein